MTTEELMTMCLGMMAGDEADEKIFNELAERPKGWAAKYRMAMIGIDDDEVAGR